MASVDKYNKVISVKFYRLYYVLQRTFVWFLYQIIWGVKVEGEENVSYTEPFIILANHCSNIDPPLIGITIKRPIAYMAKAELFKIPILKTLIHFSGAFPIKRKSGDQSYLNNTKYALETGWLLTIFPEGGRSSDGKLMNFKSGASRVLLNTNVAFLPVAIINSDNAWGKGKKLRLRQPMIVKIGKLVRPEEYLPKNELSEEEKIDYVRNVYYQKVLELLPEKHKPNV
ncbi:MAG: lysophospholipid acyltransferase family protein [Candidatus Sericytochromatia bacterium]